MVKGKVLVHSDLHTCERMTITQYDDSFKSQMKGTGK